MFSFLLLLFSFTVMPLALVQRKMISLNYKSRVESRRLLQIEGDPFRRNIITRVRLIPQHYFRHRNATTMSLSPPVRRLSSASSVSSSKREEDLINAYEAEEERIINVLSRKLEKVRLHMNQQQEGFIIFNVHCPQLQEEKIELENVLEAESESHVNRLSRELSALRLAQQLAANQQNGGSPGGGGGGAASSIGINGDGTQSPTLLRLPNPLAPSSEDMLEAMRRENEQLRNRLVDTEREFIRISRLNEIYREELIQHRRRVRCLSFPFPIFLALLTSCPLSPTVRTPRGQPHRSIGARPVLPAHA